MGKYKIENCVKPLRVRLNGFVGELYGKVIEKRMTCDFAVENILAEAEEPFFSKSDDVKAPVGFWRGEFWGKWLISAVRACKYEKSLSVFLYKNIVVCNARVKDIIKSSAFSEITLYAELYCFFNQRLLPAVREHRFFLPR